MKITGSKKKLNNYKKTLGKNTVWEKYKKILGAEATLLSRLYASAVNKQNHNKYTGKYTYIYTHNIQYSIKNVFIKCCITSKFCLN